MRKILTILQVALLVFVLIGWSGRTAQAQEAQNLIYLPIIVQSRYTPPMPQVRVSEPEGDVYGGRMHIETTGVACHDVWVSVYMTSPTDYTYDQDGNYCVNGYVLTTLFLPAGHVYMIRVTTYYESWYVWPRVTEIIGDWEIR